jgi:predicted lysophospholipase L1 biosynthesis ABC-type transport system permease subunit
MDLVHAGSLSLDSLVAGLALAPLLPRASERVTASVLFGAADGLASLVATLVGTHVVVPAALYGAYVFAVVVGATTFVASSRRRSVWPVVATVAVAFSVDNLFSPTAPAPAGAASFALALLGLAVGVRLTGSLRNRLRIAWIGAGLIAAACLSVVS